MPGWDAVLTIRVTGVEAPEEQNMILTEKEQVNGNWKCGAHEDLPFLNLK